MNKNSQTKSKANSGGTVRANQPEAGLSQEQLHKEQAEHTGEGPERRIAELLTRRQVAERWSCCEHTIARRKDLKPLRFNRRLLRYRLADILAIEAAAAM